MLAYLISKEQPFKARGYNLDLNKRGIEFRKKRYKKL